MVRRRLFATIATALATGALTAHDGQRGRIEADVLHAAMTGHGRSDGAG